MLLELFEYIIHHESESISMLKNIQLVESDKFIDAERSIVY
jgi:hypothetical protein